MKRYFASWALGITVFSAAHLAAEPLVEWKWEIAIDMPTDRLFGAPIVGPLLDTDGDGAVTGRDIPSVLVTFHRGGIFGESCLTALDGRSGTVQWEACEPTMIDGGAGADVPILGDVDGDHIPEVVAVWVFETWGGMPELEIRAYSPDGTLKWLGRVASDWSPRGELALADLEGDGKVEIVSGSQVFQGENGAPLWKGTAGVGADWWSGGGSFSHPVNLDGDGSLEVLAGNTAYRADGTVLWTNPILSDGYAAPGDLDVDGQPEIALAADGRVHGMETDGSLLWLAPASERLVSAPPTIADLDGDGRLEIATHVGRRDDGVGTPSSSVLALRGDGSELWTTDLPPFGASCAAPVAFDFQGDGAYELILPHLDDVTPGAGPQLFFLDGRTGEVLYAVPGGVGWGLTGVAVADVDGDGSAEVVAPWLSQEPGPTRKGGLVVYGDPSWVCTRRIWNEQAYHVTNVLADGTIPVREDPAWALDVGLFRGQLDRPPIADAGPDQVVGTGPGDEECLAPFVLEGTGREPDGDLIEHRWYEGADLLSREQMVRLERPPGAYAFAFGVADSCAETRDEVRVEVVDDTPPTLALEADACLWPPNHKTVCIPVEELIATASDNCTPDPALAYRIAGVGSDEPDDGLGDGHTLGDVSFDDSQVCVRAERDGRQDGRLYTVEVEVRDEAGNAARAHWRVRVVHDQRGHDCPSRYTHSMAF